MEMALNVGNIVFPGSFNPKTDKWRNYKEQLLCGFDALGYKCINDDKVRSLFLAQCGKEIYTLLTALLVPSGPTNVNFEEIIRVLDQFYEPEINEILLAGKFHQRIQQKNESMQEYISAICALAAGCNFKDLKRQLRDRVCDVGVTTEEIDRVVHEACVERECYPSPLNYHNFPNSCCTSVNEVICHGIPDLRPLQDGDLCNVDVTVYHRGFHGDLNETFFVGSVPETSRKLVQVTHECLQRAIEIVKPGEKYREIGNVIQKHAQANGFSVVRSYCGHGIHRLFHTAPNVPHYAKNKAVGVMKPGHCFTIEPMINEGGWRDEQWPDHWTAVTADGSRSAQFEQTLLVTETGCDVLTKRGAGRPWFMDQLEKLNAMS